MKRERPAPQVYINDDMKRERAAPQVYINDDMIFEILMLVPQKSLSRFRSVSKSWHNLISTHPLLRQRLETTVIIHEPYHHITKLLVLSLPAADSSTPLSSPKPFLNLQALTNPIGIAASTNGLFFCVPAFPDLREECYLCNPHTQECVVLPTPNRWDPFTLAAGLAFEPGKDGGGKATYKIVTMHAVDGYSRNALGFEIYSSENPGAWRVSQEVCWVSERNHNTCYLLVRGDSAVFYRSVLLWLEPTYKVVAFDTVSETSRCVALPLPPANQLDAISRTLTIGWLGENCGSLFFVIVTRLWCKSQLMVWKLADLSRGQWTSMLYTVDMGFLFSIYPNLVPWPDTTKHHLYHPVAIELEGDFVLLSTDCGKTLLLDVKRNTLHLIVQDQLEWARADCLFKPQFIHFSYHPTTDFLVRRRE